MLIRKLKDIRTNLHFTKENTTDIDNINNTAILQGFQRLKLLVLNTATIYEEHLWKDVCTVCSDGLRRQTLVQSGQSFLWKLRLSAQVFYIFGGWGSEVAASSCLDVQVGCSPAAV